MIRPYSIGDKKELIDLLKLNTPVYFDNSEESDFIDYLDNHIEQYFVVEEHGKIIAAGGINYFEKDKLARISWDIVHPDFHGKGIGKQLTQYRIDQIKKNPAIQWIVVRTTQLVYKFYEKMGFELEKIQKDFWAKGFDLYQMSCQLPTANCPTANCQLPTANCQRNTPIGIFDSGYGGLTVLREIVKTLPQYDYLYLGDNARSPYGPRDFDTIYNYTLECVQYLFGQGCPLVILACNTASAKALRNIQQLALPKIAPERRVLGVIRPTAEVIGDFSDSKKVGVLGTVGTVRSESYLLEIGKFFPDTEVFQQACPMWVPLVENGELEGTGTDFFVKKYLDELLKNAPDIDTLLLACTHYPLLLPIIQRYLPENIKVISQGEIVAKSLQDYLARHPEIAGKCSKNGLRVFHTTDSTADFDGHASAFYGEGVSSVHVAVCP